MIKINLINQLTQDFSILINFNTVKISLKEERSLRDKSKKGKKGYISWETEIGKVKIEFKLRLNNRQVKNIRIYF